MKNIKLFEEFADTDIKNVSNNTEFTETVKINASRLEKLKRFFKRKPNYIKYAVDVPGTKQKRISGYVESIRPTLEQMTPKQFKMFTKHVANEFEGHMINLMAERGVPTNEIPYKHINKIGKKIRTSESPSEFISFIKYLERANTADIAKSQIKQDLDELFKTLKRYDNSNTVSIPFTDDEKKEIKKKKTKRIVIASALAISGTILMALGIISASRKIRAKNAETFVSDFLSGGDV